MTAEYIPSGHPNKSIYSSDGAVINKTIGLPPRY